MPTAATVKLEGIVPASGELPALGHGDKVRISDRFPVGHYRLPTYLRGKSGTIEEVIPTKGVDNEEEAYGRNAGGKGFYYRVALPLTTIWPDYAGSPRDGLRIEIFENWLEKI